MALVVQKYGGSSVATTGQIQDLARRIVARHDSGDQVVVVVSAMGKSTDALVRQARELAEHPDPREMDMLVSAGERISIAMMSSPTMVRESLKLSIKSAIEIWDCSSWVCSCNPERALPCRPCKEAVTPLTRSSAARLSAMS